MNLDVLDFLIINEGHIEEKASSEGVEPNISAGIIRKLLGNKGDLKGLSDNQMYHYNKVIRPLLEDVQCEGPIGMFEDEQGHWVSSCLGKYVVDDESLYQSYFDEDFKCQICRYESEKMK